MDGRIVIETGTVRIQLHEAMYEERAVKEAAR